MTHILTRRLLAVGLAGAIGLGVAGVAVAQNTPAAPARKAAKPRVNQRKALNLTPEQQKKAKALREEYRQKFLAILTPAQRQQWQQQQQARRSRAGQRKNRRMRMGKRRAPAGQPMMRSMNLSEAQRAQLQPARVELRSDLRNSRALQGPERRAAARAAREKYRSALNRVLTPEQQQMMRPAPGSS